MDLRGRVALVVDDDPASLLLLERVLKYMLGCEVRSVNDGKEAKEELKNGKVDIVFSDISMPDTSGWDLIEYVRSDPDLTHVVMIAQTAHVMVGDKEKTLAAGFDGFLGKPFYPSELKENLDTIFHEMSQRKANGK